MRLIGFGWRNLFRRRTRTGLTVAAIAVAVAATTTLLSIAWHYAESADKYYQSRGVDLVVVRAGVAERLTSSLHAAAAHQLKAMPGVVAVDGSLTEMVSIGGFSLIGIPLHGYDPSGFTAASLDIQSGRALRPGDRNVVIVGTGIMESIQKELGDTIAIEGSDFKILGTFSGATPLESNSLVAPLADVQNLMDRTDQVSEFQVRVADDSSGANAVRELCQRIESLRDEHDQPSGFKALPTRDFVDSDTETRLALAMAYGTSSIAMLLTLLGVLNTMLMMVFERTKELGILRAIGWPVSRVIKLVLSESLLLAICGATCGLLIAATSLFLLGRWSATSTLVDQSLSPAAAACGFTMAMAACVLGAIYPAYRAATIPCTEALHHD
jgi:putative ABC transport system permease protein